MMPRTRHADEIQAELERLREKVRVLEAGMRSIRNSLGAYRYYEDSSCLQDADNIAKAALAATAPEAGEDK